MKGLIFKLFIVLILLLVGCRVLSPQSTLKPTPTTPLLGYLEGKVFDAFTKEPLSGVKVSFAETRISALTDSKGYFKIANFPGEQTIILYKKGYERKSKQIIIIAGDTIQEEYSLTAIPVQKSPITCPILYITDYFENQLYVVNLNNDEIISNTYNLKDAQGIARYPGGFLYVVSEGEKAVWVISPNEYKPIGYIGVGEKPKNILCPPHSKYLFVTNSKEDNVTVINTEKNYVVKKLLTGKGPLGITCDENGKLIYVTNSLADTVSIINSVSLSVVETISVGKFPNGIMAFQDKVYVIHQVGGDLWVLNPMAHQVLGKIPLGGAPFNGMILPSLKKLYILDYLKSYLIVMDLEKLDIIKKIPVGKNPVNLVYSNSTGKIYVANSGEGTISVIDKWSDIEIKRLPVGECPWGLLIEE